MTIYSHMYTIAFVVMSENAGELVTEQEILDGIAYRMQNLALSGEAIEAVGLPDDTFVVEEE